jgi:hypothetical protein
MNSSLGRILTELAWSGWGALGAGAWGSAHRSWSVDPEALLLLTGSIEDRDPRLHGESLRWMGAYGHLVSRTRLRRLLETWPSTPAWAEYAAGLGVVTGQTWPGAGDKVAGDEVASGGGQRMGEQLVLRLRAGIGVGVRSEIVRILLVGTVPTPATAAELAGEAGYGKRSVASAAEQMAAAGVLIGTARGNAITYRLRDPASWAALFGPVPNSRLSFLAACRAGSVLYRGLQVDPGLEDLADGGEIVRSVAVRHALGDAAIDLASLGLSPPRLIPGSDVYGPVEQFVVEAFAALARGELP